MFATTVVEDCLRVPNFLCLEGGITAKAMTHSEDTDITTAIRPAATQRARAGLQPITVTWIDGHSDTKKKAEDITIHHKRNQRADALTKDKVTTKQIVTLTTAGVPRTTYTAPVSYTHLTLPTILLV